MMFSTSLLSSALLALLALAVSANPVVTVRDAPITLQLSRSLNATNIGNLYQKDLNRAKPLQAYEKDNVVNEFFSTPAVDLATGYLATVGVGSPPTLYNLIIDIRSANTWVGAHERYVKTTSSSQTGTQVSVNYGSHGGLTGPLYTDTVTLGAGLSVEKQSLGVASTVQGFYGFDGALGLGPVGLTAGTLSSGPNVQISTVTESLFAAHLIPENSVAMSFQPFTKIGARTGQLTWGDVDKSKFKGSITYTYIDFTSESKYWEMTQTITYGGWFRGSWLGKPILSSTSGIVDTGTNILFIASDAFGRYRALTGATPDPVTRLLTISPSNFAKMRSLIFKIGSTNFEFTANAQMRPRALNPAIGGTHNKIYLIVADIGHSSGEGLDFVNGLGWLGRFYTVYDTTNKRIGIANTPFTHAKSN